MLHSIVVVVCCFTLLNKLKHVAQGAQNQQNPFSIQVKAATMERGREIYRGPPAAFVLQPVGKQLRVVYI